MPPKKSKEAWYRDWIGRLNGNSVYTINSSKNGKGIYCEACQQQVFSGGRLRQRFKLKLQVNVDEFTQLKQHNATAKHQQGFHRINEKEKRKKQMFLDATTSNIPDQFTFDLASTMISANIPFAKIDNKAFSSFLERNIGKSIPTGQTLWNYLEHCFKQVFKKSIL